MMIAVSYLKYILQAIPASNTAMVVTSINVLSMPTTADYRDVATRKSAVTDVSTLHFMKC
jgi:hypothetical protein